MLKKIALLGLTLTLLTGCGGSSSSTQDDQTESKGKLFGGKCAENQNWLGSLESAISVPADWQSVYDLVNQSSFDDYWGLASEGTTFSMEERAEWGVYTARLAAAVIQSNYSEAIRMYELLMPLMEKIDLQCAVAVTGSTGLSSTIIP
jgi:hypothetical protein